MKGFRKIGLFLLIIVLVIQFIQPVRNVSPEPGENDISHAYTLPERVRETLKEKCYDCHSNQTRYDWYFNIQPLGWWLASHIYEGKSQLNFSEFKTYQAGQAREKLRQITGMVNNRSLHLKGYTFFHPGSAITTEDEQAIHAWVNTLLSPGN